MLNVNEKCSGVGGTAVMRGGRVFHRPFTHGGICPSHMGGQVQGDKALMGGLMRGDIDLMGGG